MMLDKKMECLKSYLVAESRGIGFFDRLFAPMF